MIPRNKWLVRLYRRMLHLYPANFRHEYQQEMLTVFELQIIGVNPVSIWGALGICWRELRDLPAGIISAHLRERRRNLMINKLDGWFSHPQGSWKEIFLAGMPFVLIAFLPGFLSLFPFIDQIPDLLKQLILLTIAVVLIGLGIVGLLVRLPRWSLVYAGILLTVIAYIVLFWLYSSGILPSLAQWSVGRMVVFLGIFLFVLFTIVIAMVFAASKVRLTARFVNSIKADQTLLPFMLYGGSLVLVYVNYDEVNGGIFLVFAALVMMAGAWGYLRAGSVNGRLGSLFLGISLALLSTMFANLYHSIIPLPPDVNIGPFAINRVVINILLTWITALLMIFLPVIVKFPFGDTSFKLHSER